MKAIQISRTGGPEVLDYVELEAPSAGPGQVVVRTEAISVNYADVMTREGSYPIMPPLPTVPGLEAAGVIEELGEGVTGVEVGQRVSFMSQGCYAEKVLVAANALIPLPPDIDIDSAAAFPANYLTAHHLIHTIGHARRGQWIMIYAAVGGVGIAATQLAKLAGLKVIGLTSSDRKMAQARELGADEVFLYEEAGLAERVRALTDGKGVNLILDSVAGPGFSRNFELLAPLGQVMWFGFAGGMPPENLLESMGNHFVKGIGLRTFHLTYTIAEPYPELLNESIATMINHLQEKKIAPVIHDRIPLREAAKAHQLLQSRETVGKLILKP